MDFNVNSPQLLLLSLHTLWSKMAVMPLTREKVDVLACLELYCTYHCTNSINMQAVNPLGDQLKEICGISRPT